MAINFLSDIDLKGNKLISAAINPQASAPASATEGELYYNTSDEKLYSFDGTSWNQVGSTNTNTTYTLTAASNKITLTGSDSTTNDIDLVVASGTNATLAGSSNDITFTLGAATNTKMGGVTLYSAGSSASLTPVSQSVPTSANDRLYQVMMDKDKKAFVHIPWTNTNTEYTAGTGLTLTNLSFSLDQATSSVLGGIKLGSATALTATYETGSAGAAGRT